MERIENACSKLYTLNTENPEQIGAPKDPWRRGINMVYNAVSGNDSSARIFRFCELAGDFAQGFEGFNELWPGFGNLTKLLAKVRGLQQPLYRILLGFNYYANPKVERGHGRAHWVFRRVCPVTLIVVSVLGLTCFLEKEKILKWSTMHVTRETMEKFSRIAGTVGAGVAMSFSYTDMCFHWRKKQDIDAGTSEHYKHRQAGYNQAAAGTKYLFEMLYGCLVLANTGRSAQYLLKWGSVVCGISQFIHKDIMEFEIKAMKEAEFKAMKERLEAAEAELRQMKAQGAAK